MGGNTWDPNYAPGLDFLDHNFFNLKNSGQDLSNEGSISILSSVEVFIELLKHFLTNYLKLQILASYNNLRIGQDSEFAQF